MAHMADDGLEPFITECPACHTRFRVAEAQLHRAGGKVRCGACLNVFHGVQHLTFESAQTYGSEEQAQRALDALLDELADPDTAHPDAGADDVPPQEARPAPPRDTPPARRPPPRGPIFSGFEEPEEQPPLVDVREGAATLDHRFRVVDDETTARGYPFQVVGNAVPDDRSGSEHSAVPGIDAESSDQAPRRTRTAVSLRPRDAVAAAVAWRNRSTAATRAPREAERGPLMFGEVQRRRPLVWAGIVTGLLLLVAQVLWYQFEDWAMEPGWRGVYGALCGVLGCELPQQQDRSLLTTRNLAVRSHPERPDTLLVHAVILNEAEFAQPFPVLELRFTTVRGMLVAGRRFEPDQYLAGDARGMELIPPRTPVQVELTIDDPGPEAVNYFLQFR